MPAETYGRLRADPRRISPLPRTFEAGHVSLAGSGLPHEWVSDLEPGEVLERRDAVIQVDGRWVQQTAVTVPEMEEVTPLLESPYRRNASSVPAAGTELIRRP
jgi:hypothetical protein